MRHLDLSTVGWPPVSLGLLMAAHSRLVIPAQAGIQETLDSRLRGNDRVQAGSALGMQV
jgi:hypothetical protein